MAQLTELKPPDFTAIATPLTSLNFSSLKPNFTFPSVDDWLSSTPLDGLTAIVDNFNGLLQNLPAHPDELLGDLLEELQSLAGGSLEIDSLLGGLTTPFTQAGSIFDEFQTIFTSLTTDLLPSLLNLRDRPVDLTSLFPITAIATPLTTQLPAVLAPHLEQAQQLRSQLDPLITQPSPLADYQQILAAIADLPLDNTLTAAHLSQLEDQTVQSLQSQIKDLEKKFPTATDNLQTFLNNHLNPLSPALNTTLDNALGQLSPQQLAQQSNALRLPLKALETLGNADLGSAISKIQTVIQPLQTLVDQGVDKVTTTVNTVVKKVENAIATADQALVKVSALVTNTIEQLVEFIQKIDLTSLIDQAKDLFQGLMLKLHGVLNQVGEVIEQIYTFVRGMVDQAKELGKKLPLAEQFRQALAQITAFLENPQVKDAVEQAKQVINQVVTKLDTVSLEPIFDEVLTQVDTVKTSLQAIDLSQLNQMLKSALSAALDLVKEAVDPPNKVTDLVKELYKTSVGDPMIEGIVRPAKQQVDNIVNLIHQLEPGTLVGSLLTPYYEKAIASIKGFVEPDNIKTLLQPLTDLQTALLQKIDEVINPSKLLAPLMDLYNKLMTFVRSLTPEKILAPLNELLHQATQPLENLGLEQLVSGITASVRKVTDWIGNLNFDDQFLEQGIEPLIETWIQKLKASINQLDLSGLQTLLQPLRTAAKTLLDQIRLDGNFSLESMKPIQQIGEQIQDYATEYGKQMNELAQKWKRECDRLEGFTPSADLQPQYDALKSRLKSLHPIALLANLTQMIDRLNDKAAAIPNKLQDIGKGLGDRLQQGRKFLDCLLDEKTDGLKTYLNQAIDALADTVLKPLIQTLNQPLMQMKGVVQSILKLQGSLQVFDLIPQSIEKIGQAIISIKDKIRAFNFNFLVEPLGRVMEEIEKPLAAINPEPTLIVPLTQIYNKVLKMLENLNPVHLLATPRGTLTFTFTDKATSNPLTLSLGTQMAAITPKGEKIWFETLLEKEVPVGGQVEIPVRAMVSGRFSDIVVVEGVTWEIADQPNLTATHNQPVLSLVTMVQEELLGILKMFDPVKLIAEPLNEQYQKIVKLFHDLGIAKLFDVFFEKIEGINQEIESGLDRVGGSLGGLIAAMPA